MATAADAARWIAIESDDYDGLGGENGFGWARATTDDVAAGIGVSTEEAYRLLKSASKKGLVWQDSERRKELASGKFGSKKIGWAIWEVHLNIEQTREREADHPELAPERELRREYMVAPGQDPAVSAIMAGEQVSGLMLIRAAEVTKFEVDPKLARELKRAGQWVRPAISNLSTDAANAQAVLIYRSIQKRQEMKPNVTRQEAEARDAKELRRKRIDWTSDHPEARAYRQRYGMTNQLPVATDERYLSEEELEGRRFGMEPNASYYVWVLPPRSDEPLAREGPYGPYPLRAAEQLARIGASEGVHDRVVSVGKDPEARGFKIERRYAARSGSRLI